MSLNARPITACLDKAGAMSEIILNSEDADGYMTIVIGKSLESKCRAIFGYVPEYRISSYGLNTHDIMTGGAVKDMRYQVLLYLPPQKYIYYQDIAQLQSLGVQIAGIKTEKDNRLAVYLELSLDTYLVQTKEKLMLKAGDPHPQRENPSTSNQRAL